MDNIKEYLGEKEFLKLVKKDLMDAKFILENQPDFSDNDIEWAIDKTIELKEYSFVLKEGT